MKKEKPAESALAYLTAEDRRIYDGVMKVGVVLKQELCPHGITRGIDYAIAQAARKQYREAVKEASLYWGGYEVSDLWGTPRKDGIGYVGNFEGLLEES